ncbi:MAG: ADP-ribose-binding protein [Sulfolobales archaeon]|nr:ADP-ribose-binding protein [Sulfolobales archaeon]MCX8185815.1 ADP-ribose-binding protein [Sulfolobales archaeon]MDW7969300.1 ADP-ribose-binding protein [Sulfolobales archaeon]
MRTYNLGDNVTLVLIEGDITDLDVDAIVNAANSRLEHGGGVARAIVRKGGDVIQEESWEYVKKFGPVPVGGVAVTGAGKLKAKYIIHAVGPIFGDPEGDLKLASAIRSSLDKAEELGLKTIALPAISTGIYRYPYRRVAEIMAEVIKKYNYRNLKKIFICLYGTEAYKEFESVFNEYIGN